MNGMWRRRRIGPLGAGISLGAAVVGLLLLTQLRALPLAFFTFLLLSSLVVPGVLILRLVTFGLHRLTGTDPLRAKRLWTRARPWWTRVILGASAFVGSFALFFGVRGTLESLSRLGDVVVGALAAYAALQLGLRMLMGPREEDAIGGDPVEIDPGEISFGAVAVTLETRGAVAFVGLVALVPLVLVLAPIPDRFLGAAVAGDCGIALASILFFRIASRIAVGIDGVLVRGTSRERFFAYRDLDGARATSHELHLLRRGAVVLRLQMHGARALRDAVLSRISERIARARHEGNNAAMRVAASLPERLARLASSGADYRAPAVSRDTLWRLVDGHGVESAARAAALQVLASSSDAKERVRLRAAVDQCADPKVRAAWGELGAMGPAGEEAQPAGRFAASRKDR
jgi:hypothetical protein